MSPTTKVTLFFFATEAPMSTINDIIANQIIYEIPEMLGIRTFKCDYDKYKFNMVLVVKHLNIPIAALNIYYIMGRILSGSGYFVRTFRPIDISEEEEEKIWSSSKEGMEIIDKKLSEALLSLKSDPKSVEDDQQQLSINF